MSKMTNVWARTRWLKGGANIAELQRDVDRYKLEAAILPKVRADFENATNQVQYLQQLLRQIDQGSNASLSSITRLAAPPERSVTTGTVITTASPPSTQESPSSLQLTNISSKGP
jgi:hypothetical protein